MTNYEKKVFVIKAMTDMALSFHDGHDHYDAVKQGPGVPDIPFAKCSRRMCSAMREAIELIRNVMPRHFSGN